MSRRIIALGISLALLLVSGLATSVPLASAQAAPATVNVVIIPGSGSATASEENLPGYTPSTITVVIGVNNTVMWLNNDTVSGKGTAHTVTDATEPTGGGFSGSGEMLANATYSFTFTVPGTYNYFCSYHAWMMGTVVVEAASTSTVSSTSTHVTPEFPAAYLAVILFAVIAAAVVVAPRFRPKASAGPAPGPSV
jgi:plastocyanin